MDPTAPETMGRALSFPASLKAVLLPLRWPTGSEGFSSSSTGILLLVSWAANRFDTVFKSSPDSHTLWALVCNPENPNVKLCHKTGSQSPSWNKQILALSFTLFHLPLKKSFIHSFICVGGGTYMLQYACGGGRTTRRSWSEIKLESPSLATILTVLFMHATCPHHSTLSFSLLMT